MQALSLALRVTQVKATRGLRAYPRNWPVMESAMSPSQTEREKRAEALGAKAEAAAQKDADTKAELEAEARAVDDKTARLKSLRLAKEAAKKVPEANAPPPRRKKR